MQSSSQIVTTNKPTPIFYRLDALPVAQPTVPKNKGTWAVLVVQWATSLTRSDLLPGWHCDLRPSMYKFLKRQQEFALIWSLIAIPTYPKIQFLVKVHLNNSVWSATVWCKTAGFFFWSLSRSDFAKFPLRRNHFFTVILHCIKKQNGDACAANMAVFLQHCKAMVRVSWMWPGLFVTARVSGLGLVLRWYLTSVLFEQKVSSAGFLRQKT